MKRHLTILCDQDSVQYSQKRQVQTAKHRKQGLSPFAKTSKDFSMIEKMTLCQTPQSEYPRQSIQFKSPKYAGIIEKNILQRLEFYDQKHKEKKQNQDMSIKIREEELGLKEMRDKPQINQISKSIYKKIKNERKLSPNVLERFQTYECQRVSRNAKYDLLKTYGMEIKNTSSTCRKNINSKSRSPLKDKNQSNLNKSFQRSKSKSALKKTIDHSRNVGKIVCRKPKNPQTEKKQQNFSTSSYQVPNYESFQSVTPKKNKGFLKKDQTYQKQSYESQICSVKNDPSQIIKQIMSINAPLSPVLQKKPKGQKWTVIA